MKLFIYKDNYIVNVDAVGYINMLQKINYSYLFNLQKNIPLCIGIFKMLFSPIGIQSRIHNYK